MRKIFIILFVNCLLSIVYCFSQPAIQWKKSFGSSGEDDCYSIIQTSDGGFILAGNGGANDGDITGYHNRNGWILKISSLGIIQWQKCYGGDTAIDADFPESIIQTTDGGYLFCGYTGSTDGEAGGNHGATDAWVVKLNDTGIVQWHKCYGGTYSDGAGDIISTNDGGYIFYAGTSSNDVEVSGNHGSYDTWIVKINNSGGIQWQKCYGTSNLDGGGLKCMVKTNDGGYAFGMSFGAQNGDCPSNCMGGFGFVKIDSLGAIQWSKCYGGTGGDQVMSMVKTLDGGFAMTGWTGSHDGDVSGNHGSRDYWVLKLKATGVIQWSKCYGGSDDDEPNSIIQNPDGSYVVAGFTNSNDGDVTINHGYHDYWIIKINSSGSLIWQKSLGGSGDDVAYSIVRCTDGGYAIAGYSNSNDGNVSGHHGIPYTTNTDYWVVKLAPDTAAGVDEIRLANAVSVYPNPASSSITVKSEEQRVMSKELKVTDVYGRDVYKETLTGADTKIDVSKWSAGVYFYEVREAKGTSRGKFIVQQ